jgi:hypothetical protein
MKIEIQPEQKVEEIKYPCLMIAYDGDIVIMLQYKEGVIIKGIDHEIGYYATTWDMRYFKPFKGKITLEND